MERVAVDRPVAQRVETELVESRRTAPVVRGVFIVRDAGASTAAPGAAGAILVADREPGGQSDGGGFGPPPPPVPFDAPGEGGSRPRVSPGAGATGGGGGGGDGDDLIREAACGARDALGAAGAPLDPACKPGGRSVIRETLGATGELVDDAVAVELSSGG